MPSTFTDLPVELVEAVLILSAASDPSSIAALSRAGRFFHDIIYRSNRHLWREIFLTTFDDPRPVLSCLSTISGGHSSFNALEFNWTKEYVRRISAARYIKYPLPVLPVEASARTCTVAYLIDTSPLLSVVQSLLSTIETSTPFPSSPTISLTILTDPSSQEKANSPFAPMTNSPPFPPLFFLLTTQYNSVLTSLNATWLNDLLAFGFPPELTRTLFATLPVNVPGHPPIHPSLAPAAYLGESEVCHLFHKLVCCTGFVPIPTPSSLVKAEPVPPDLPVPITWAEAQSASSSMSPSIASVTEDKVHSEPSPDIQRPQPSFYSAEEQFADARRLARRRVYDIRYLSPARMWGPFQPVRRGNPDTSTSSHGGEDEDEDEYDDENDEDDEDEDGLRLTWTTRRLKVSPPIVPYELVPDYVWLASARIVVEANLQEVFERSEESNAFLMGDVMPLIHKVHTTRVGGSPGFWNGWVNHPGNMGEEGSMANSNESSSLRANGKSNEGEGVEGWDWAGVAGIWKRCVCWLDYRELLRRNCAPESFADDSIQEACRMIPMTIRITGYSQTAIPPGSTIRPLPTIHIEGESIGSDRSLRDVRKVKGTVGMIGDGAIRWSIVSSAPGSSEPEWSSEAVQIGGPGAAAGLLGMWTGALHERPDPLGPFWAWKVA